MGFNKIQVELFYSNLTKLMADYGFPPSRIYNMDESGITTVPNKIPKVIAAKGKRSVNKVRSAESGQLITAVCCFSASGHYIPPATLMSGATPDSVLFVSESGYINSEIYMSFLKHFQNHAKANKESPVLLILDNHSSHCSLDAVLYCRKNNIDRLTIPPHSSHRTQPLDRCFFKALKDYYGEYCDHWLVNHPGRTITQDNVAEIFGCAYNKVCTIEKAVNAFRMCGIVPVNKFIFCDEDFLPATLRMLSFQEKMMSL
ncbi:DDE superfamily endonuclease [Popillia japonica]|uniref:DDE superfamily endonuclease n=1 Tax=Popillia japonica TaxID=7064 RepID=A0AAW1LER5_POPJA